MNKEKALELAKKHFSDIIRTRPEDRTSAVKEAAKFWEIVVEALKKE